MAIGNGDFYFAIDCPDTLALAGFYSEVLGLDLEEGSDAEWATIGSGARSLAFQQVDDYRAPEWPGQDVPQQAHVDVMVANLDEAEAAVLALGATKTEFQPGTSFRVFLDPAGHPFCLCQAH